MSYWKNEILPIGTLVTVRGAIGRIQEIDPDTHKYYAYYRMAWKNPKRRKTHGKTWYKSYRLSVPEQYVTTYRSRIDCLMDRIGKLQYALERYGKIIDENEGLSFQDPTLTK